MLLDQDRMQRQWCILEGSLSKDLLAVASAHASLQQILNRLYDQSDTRQAATDTIHKTGALHAATVQEHGKRMPYHKQ
jgi:chorismate-pyruvate lyase